LIERTSLPSDKLYKQAFVNFIASRPWHLFITVPIGGCESDDAVVERFRIIEAKLCGEYLGNRYHKMADHERFVSLIAFEGERRCGTRHAHVLVYVPAVTKKCTRISREMLLSILREKFQFMWATLKPRGTESRTDRERWYKMRYELQFGDANVARSTYAVKDVRLRDVPWSRIEFITPPKRKTFSNRNLSVIHNRNRQKRHLLQRNGDPLLLNVA
jgi:hypothetical protein